MLLTKQNSTPFDVAEYDKQIKRTLPFYEEIMQQTKQQGRHKIIFRTLERVSDCKWENRGRGGFACQTLRKELFSDIYFRVHWAFEGLWFSHGGDFMGVLYAGGDIGEEVNASEVFEYDREKVR